MDHSDLDALDDHELRSLVRALRERHQRQIDFMASIAHELRTPMSAIEYALLLIDRNVLNHSGRDALDVIEHQKDCLVSLVNDLMDTSRVTTGKISLKMEQVCVREVMKKSVQSARPFLQSHKFEFEQPSPDWQIMADAYRLEQVFVNLLTNAGKYTESGGSIRFWCEMFEDFVLFHVKDSGVGIECESRDRIFDLYSQEPRSFGRSRGGIGMGLSLVKSLVNMHGGEVSALSDGPNCGSEFLVSIPKSLRNRNYATSWRGEGARILIIEDDFAVGDILAKMINLHGHDAIAVMEGQEGVEMAVSLCPDVILIDLSLKDISGYEVCRRIAERGVPAMRIALSGRNPDERSQNAGFHHYFQKPLNRDAFFALIEKRQCP